MDINPDDINTNSLPDDIPEGQAFLLCGRAIPDYIVAGAHIPNGYQIVPCKICRVPIALSHEAQNLYGKRGAIPVCGDCIEGQLARVTEAGQSVEIRATQVAKDHVVNNDGNSRARYKRLVALAKGKPPNKT